MRFGEDPFCWTGRTGQDRGGQSSIRRRTDGTGADLREESAEALLILFEPGGIDVRQIIGEHLHLFFLRHGTGEYGIDGSVHGLASFLSCSQ